ncbi:hypothetical protein RD792_002531 [Penstemon davidsonii]|uniref:t-SNARE coiled-coil homology domain-containing protein n=1 Tax=Penstemon davidsonii TaxID=160366 RepID=A0ABR0DSB5_9LAMI|nr:hypothetical protein RD792_002531 [Penstemon davidsonii]
MEETILSTKHIALAVNEELDLHTRLIDNLDEHVEVTDSQLQLINNIFVFLSLFSFWEQRVRRRLAMLNKRTKGGCSCLCLIMSVIGMVVLVFVTYMLIRYL